MTLQELQQEAQSLREKLSENLRKQTKVRIQDFILLHGFNVGDKVTWKDGRKVKHGIIAGVKHLFGVFYTGYELKKDGTPSARTTLIVDPKTIQRIS